MTLKVAKKIPGNLAHIVNDKCLALVERNRFVSDPYFQGGICGIYWGTTGGHVLVTEFRGMALNGLFCADMLRPLDLVPLTDFIYKYHLAYGAVMR